jgi:hypothetical protein
VLEDFVQYRKNKPWFADVDRWSSIHTTPGGGIRKPCTTTFTGKRAAWIHEGSLLVQLWNHGETSDNSVPIAKLTEVFSDLTREQRTNRILRWKKL